MSVPVNDLVPNDDNLFTKSQKRVHLGVNGGTKDGSFDFSSITPFCHIHLVSGIFHDPAEHAYIAGAIQNSGVVRYCNPSTAVALSKVFRLQLSNDGGLTFDSIALNKSDVTLQNAYENGPTISLSSAESNLIISSADNTHVTFKRETGEAINFTSTNQPAQPPDNPGNAGLWYQTNGFINKTPTDNRALGISTFGYNTGGSGLVNLSVGSGIVQYRPSAAQTLSENADVFTRINFDTADFDDLNYAWSAGTAQLRGSGIKFFSEGLYECHYNVAVEKTVGTGARNYAARARLQTVATADGTTINSSSSYCGSATLALPRAGMGASFLFNAQPGNLLAIEVGFNSLFTAGQSAQTTISGTWVLVKKIGPRRNI